MSPLDTLKPDQLLEVRAFIEQGHQAYNTMHPHSTPAVTFKGYSGSLMNPSDEIEPHSTRTTHLNNFAAHP